jgi:uncharacterized protein YndB with AHSA1/START domain
MTTPDVPHRFEITVEVPGTPEAVWQAIATANGISSWMLPTDLEERVGGVVRFHMGETDSVGEVTAYDAPHRIAYVEPDWAALGGHAGADVTPMATEFLVEAKAGGTCVVRVVSSAFGTGAEWEDEFWESMAEGWAPAFEILRLVLQDFPGQTVTVLDAAVEVDGEQPAVLAAMRSSVFERGVEGEWVQETPISSTLRTTAPVPGFLVVMANPSADGRTWVAVQGHLFSPDAAGWVESTKKEWQVWLEGLGA